MAQLMNDNCSGAVLLECGNSQEASTSGWTPSIFSLHGDMWFEFVGNDQNVEIDICGALGTCGLGLNRYNNTCESAIPAYGMFEFLEECNWNWFTYQKIRFFAEEGWTFLIRVSGPINLNTIITMSAHCVGPPLMACDDPSACNYSDFGEWMNYSCDYANCSQACNPDQNTFQLFTPLPTVLDASVTGNCNCSFTVYNEDNESVIEWIDPCFLFLINEEYCTSSENIIEIGGQSYLHETHCLPIGCYTIVFQDNSNYICNIPWILRSAGSTETLSGLVGGTAQFCILPDEGCLDPMALNFDPFAQFPGFCHYPGDFNQDGLFSITDLLLLFNQFGCLLDCPEFDMNGDNIINVTDFTIWLSLLNG